MSMILADISKWINKHYTVIDSFQLVGVDHDFDLLEQRLLNNRRDVYGPKDLILVNHFDTDYYDSQRLRGGLLLGNLIYLFKKIDIPLHSLLLYTNHIGLSKEVEVICKDHDINDRPRIFETIIDRSMVDAINPWEFDTATISRHALCLMGAGRSHRHAIRNTIYDKNLRNNLYMAYRAKEIK